MKHVTEGTGETPVSLYKKLQVELRAAEVEKRGLIGG